MDDSKRIHQIFSIGWKEYSVALLFFHIRLLLRLSSSKKMIRVKRRHLKGTMRLHYCYSSRETVLRCHVHKGHVEFYLRQWAKKEDEVVSPLDSFHLSFPASRFPSHGSSRPRANLRATISVSFHLSLFFLSIHLFFLFLLALSLSCFLFLLTFLCFHVSLSQPFFISLCLFCFSFRWSCSLCALFHFFVLGLLIQQREKICGVRRDYRLRVWARCCYINNNNNKHQ